MSKSAVATVVTVALSLSLINMPADAQTGSTTSSTTSSSTSSTSSATTSSATSAPPQYTQNYSWTKSGQPATSSVSTTRPAATTTSTTTSTTTATTTAAGTTTSKKKKVDDSTTIQSQQNIAKTTGWNTFDNYIGLQGGQEQLPLLLAITNGSSGHTPFTQVQVKLAGQTLATQKDFKGSQLQLKMDGTLNNGNNQFTILGFGPAGSAITWKLTTQKPVATAVKPPNISEGDTLTITGRNFSTVTSITKVTIGGKDATVVSTAGKTITAKVPGGLKAGDNDVIVSVAGMLTKPLKVGSRPAPEVSSISMVSAPPGQPLTISGKGFSDKASENEVTIGGMVAPIQSSSPSSITVTIPDGLQYPQWNLPVVVKTNNVESKAVNPGCNLLNVQQRVIPNDGAPEQ